MKKQARFWIDYKGSVVRLKMNPEQIVDVVFGGATDEGYSWTAERYRFDGSKIVCETSTDARDCDGRMQRNSSAACLVRNLSAGWYDPEAKVTFPGWEQMDYSQRDHSAEAMNY